MQVYGAAVPGIFPAPDQLIDAVPKQGDAGISQEQQQQFILFDGELDGNPPLSLPCGTGYPPPRPQAQQQRASFPYRRSTVSTRASSSSISKGFVR